MKNNTDAILKVEIKLSIRLNLSKLDILEIFILLDVVYKLMS